LDEEAGLKLVVSWVFPLMTVKYMQLLYKFTESLYSTSKAGSPNSMES
jgi:hypothetical protein